MNYATLSAIAAATWSAKQDQECNVAIGGDEAGACITIRMSNKDRDRIKKAMLDGGNVERLPADKSKWA